MAGKKLPKNITDKRIMQCYKLRYIDDAPFGVKEWMQYCHEHYGDKSEMAYSKYWMRAGEMYKLNWKEKLQKQLDPAVDKLIELLHNESPTIQQRAIDQIMKYCGEDVQKVEANIKGDIEVKWGTED